MRQHRADRKIDVAVGDDEGQADRDQRHLGEGEDQVEAVVEAAPEVGSERRGRRPRARSRSGSPRRRAAPGACARPVAASARSVATLPLVCTPSMAMPPISRRRRHRLAAQARPQPAERVPADQPRLDQHRDDQDQAEEGRHRARAASWATELIFISTSPTFIIRVTGTPSRSTLSISTTRMHAERAAEDAAAAAEDRGAADDHRGDDDELQPLRRLRDHAAVLGHLHQRRRPSRRTPTSGRRASAPSWSGCRHRSPRVRCRRWRRSGSRHGSSPADRRRRSAKMTKTKIWLLKPQDVVLADAEEAADSPSPCRCRRSSCRRRGRSRSRGR